MKVADIILNPIQKTDGSLAPPKRAIKVDPEAFKEM